MGKQLRQKTTIKTITIKDSKKLKIAKKFILLDDFCD